MRFKLALGIEKKRREKDNSANDSALGSEHNDGLLQESRGSCKVQKSREKGRKRTTKGGKEEGKEEICLPSVCSRLAAGTTGQPRGPPSAAPTPPGPASPGARGAAFGEVGAGQGTAAGLPRAGNSKVYRGDVPSAHSRIPGCLDQAAGRGEQASTLFFPFHLHTK